MLLMDWRDLACKRKTPRHYYLLAIYSLKALWTVIDIEEWISLLDFLKSYLELVLF